MNLYENGYVKNTDENGVSDMTTISDIDEHGISLNLRVRYLKDLIYTYAGTILIAVNPYKIIELFSSDYVFKYRGNKFGNLPPHVFALTEAAFRNIQDNGTNQSCVISGESGAGKTETTKFILQYLCTVSNDVSTWVQQQILEANTILEAFGNAKTVKNDNSSRFGKFMQVCFDTKLCIKGCIIQDYLLELSRITFQSPGERNYHVFYQLVAEGSKNEDMAKTFHLKPLDSYRYLYSSGMIDTELNYEAEAKRFEDLLMAFTVLQIPQLMIDGIIKVLSAILWLGNLNFSDIDGEKCELDNTDEAVVHIISELLGLNAVDMNQVFLLRQINVRGNITEIPLKFQEARENRHAMAKALYSRSFAWLISQINACINPGQDASRFLGVLDIFGFENFAVNSFEQLCINYTNEKLHKFFNHYVFALEQEIYEQEEINFEHIQFTDNTTCLELIEKPPRCILKLLTEQCHMPKGSDLAYLTNLHSEFENNSCYVKGSDRRLWKTEFGIKHYAGCVLYQVNGFVDKNRDVQQDVFFDLMSRSENLFVQELSSYQDLLSLQTHNQISSNSTSTVSRGTSKGKLTVSDTFRQQLQSLVDVLQSTKPWYVRCIKPNAEKLPNDFNDSLVLDQLKYLGMLDIIRIRREGYPIHLTFQDFINKYRCLTQTKSYNAIYDIKNIIILIIQELKVAKNEWQIGKSKVFLRSRAHESIEELRKQLINSKALLIQSTWKKYNAENKYSRIRNAAIKIQQAYKAWKLRIEFIRKRRAAIIIQSHLRGVFAREVAAALREMRRVDEEMRKREKIEADRKKREEENILRLKSEEEQKALDECQRLVQDELDVLCHMAEQINSKFNNADEESKSNNKDLSSTSQHNNESVDLDNLFAFLSEVTPNSTSNPLIDDISDKMDILVHDLDNELYHSKDMEKELNEDLNNRNASRSSKGIPTLPEPTMPPPPPPSDCKVSNTDINVSVSKNANIISTNSVRQLTVHIDEPIYEAVLPKEKHALEENTLSNKPNITTHLPIKMKKLRSKSPASNNFTTTSSTSPSQNFRLSGNDFPMPSPSSPKNSRPNSRTSSIGSHNHLPNEREQRRKFRIEKKLQEMQQIDLSEKENEIVKEETFFDILEFAENFFNTHERSSEGSIMKTLTRKNSKTSDIIPKYEMVTYYRGNTIPSSHIHMYDPENIVIACNIFRDLCKYSKGDLNSEKELQVIQSIITQGIEREELRDEILVQCMRQSTNNPYIESTDRIWLLMCLIIVAFQPSKNLFRYFESFLKRNLELLDGKLKQYAQWCLDNCKCTKVSPRLHPPSSVEVAAMRRLGTIVCRFFFLDGRTKAIDVHPTDTASDAVTKLADKLNLCNTEGWAIYQSRPDGEDHVKSHDYLYDIIANWELKQTKTLDNNSITSATLKKKTQQLGSGENRFVFKRRLFKATRELSQDPVEINLLYAQAVYSVVKRDDFPVSEKVALQLAGLQAQVALGDPSHQPKPEYYTDVNNYLPSRVSKTREEQFWVPILAQAHRQYGGSRTEMTAKVLYLSCVMQYPLYGTTMFDVKYRGYWNYGNSLIFGINWEGIALIRTEDKFVLFTFKYSDIESIMLDPSDYFITITLARQIQNQPNMAANTEQRCFVFETLHKNEIGALIVSYYPALSNWLIENESQIKKSKGITNEDRIRLYHNVVVCRRHLIEEDIVRKPQDSSGGFLRNTLRRLSKHRLEKLRAEGNPVQDHGETYKGFPHAFWAFSRLPLQQSLSKLSEADDVKMMQIFQSILKYAGLGQCGDTIQRAEDEHITLIQSIMEKCMSQESLLNEFYLQLIKQTTDHPDPNSRVNLRHWALMSLACSVILPPQKNVRKYLIIHLKRCASDFLTEEGKYARFAEKCFFKTQKTRTRQWRPSREEIICTINRRPIYARFHFMDGQYHSVEFHPSATAREVMELVKSKIGLPENTEGYAIYEVLGSLERSLLPEEKVADVMSRWEKYNNAAIQAAQQSQHNTQNYINKRQHYIFLFKKHLFFDHYLNFNDPVEKELLYHQVLHGLRSERYPITEMEAVMLTALQAQVELGDCTETLQDYRTVASHCLPPRFVPNIPHEAVAMHHQSLRGTPATDAKKSFLNLIQSWPLHKATIYDVMQSFTSNWPRILWLAVDQKGIHLLEHRSRNTLCTYEYSSILQYSPHLNCLMIITGTDKKQSKIILTTSQAFQIANLIREYSLVVRQILVDNKKNSLPPPSVPDQSIPLTTSRKSSRAQVVSQAS